MTANKLDPPLTLTYTLVSYIHKMVDQRRSPEPRAPHAAMIEDIF